MQRQLKLRQGSCTVSETAAAQLKKRGGAPCRVKIHSRKPYLRCVNGCGKVILDTHPAPDQHQKLIASKGSVLWPCLRCLVDVRYRDRELSCSQTE